MTELVDSRMKKCMNKSRGNEPANQQIDALLSMFVTVFVHCLRCLPAHLFVGVVEKGLQLQVHVHPLAACLRARGEKERRRECASGRVGGERDE